MTDDERDELEYLRWFCINADFGPADADVQHYMQAAYTKETGKPVPNGWKSDE